jgi:phage tail sheath protein FI
MSVSYPGVYIEEVPGGARTIPGVPTSVTAFVGRTQRGPEEPLRIHSFAEFEATFGGLWEESPLSYAVQHFYLNGGSEALIVRVINDGSTVVTDADVRAALNKISRADTFSLLCVPPLSRDTDIDSSTRDAAASLCRNRRAFYIVDAPLTWDSSTDPIAAAEAGVGSSATFMTRTKDAAVFFPRIKARDPLQGNAVEVFAPCGAIAGTFARTDTQRGVWKAPAGVEASLIGASGLNVSMTDHGNGRLNRLGVNCLRSFPAAGNVVWGSRTLDGADAQASDWKYIPVRRLALFIEESLDQGTQWVVFETNDEPLWAQIRLSIGAFLDKLFRQGAFQGRTPHQAYFVKCDSETITQNDIDAGVVNIVVGFAPLKPAEFVIIRIQQLMRDSACPDC